MNKLTPKAYNTGTNIALMCDSFRICGIDDRQLLEPSYLAYLFQSKLLAFDLLEKEVEKRTKI